MRAFLVRAVAAGALLSAAGSLADTNSVSHPTDYRWTLPPGFPVPFVPADNPMSDEKVELGRLLFYDKRLSATGTHACATCHQQSRAFSDGRPHAVGIHGDLHAHNAMALVNVAYYPRLQWASPELRTLEEQASRPLYNETPVEMGLKGRENEVLAAWRADNLVSSRFTRAFPGDSNPIRLENALRALASFERTLISGRSAFDRYVFDDDRAALSPAAREGMALFFSEGSGCSGCHFGINFSGPVVHADQASTPPLYANTGLYNVDGTGRYPAPDAGLETATRRDADNGSFRVPTLRNVAVSAPYMHDGSLPTLEAVLDHYTAGGRQAPLGPAAHNTHRDKKLKPFTLTPHERSALLAFLASLTDEIFLSNPRFSDPAVPPPHLERP